MYLDAKIEHIARAYGWPFVRLVERRFTIPTAPAAPLTINPAGGGVSLLIQVNGWMNNGPTARYLVSGGIAATFDRVSMRINGWQDTAFTNNWAMTVDCCMEFDTPIQIGNSDTASGAYHHCVILDIHG